MPQIGTLTATKLRPPRTPGTLVTRPRLEAQLDAGVEGPLTLLAASAGAGKTALIASWAATRAHIPVAWLSVDCTDADPRRFWRGVLEAFRHARAGEPLASLALHPGEDVDALLPALEGALAALPGPAVLVLDDLHEISGSPAIADLDRLLRRPPPALRVVIATRADPPMRIGRMRLEGSLTELRAADLAFTREETAALLDGAGIEIPDDAVALLWDRTEGWAAGLRLAALALRTHPDPVRFVAEFAGDDSTVADYLLAEVLARQPAELRDFLLRISIVGEVTGELADALTDRSDSDRLLAQLERDHALLSATGAPHSWHRLHPLFAELLRSELRYRAPGVVPELHRRAARWFEAKGHPTEALRHAAAAEDWPQVARLAGTHWVPLLLGGELDSLREALARLPITPAGADPELALAVAGAHVDAGDEPAARVWFEAARAGRDAVAPERRSEFDLATAAVGLLRGRVRGDIPEAMRHAQLMFEREGAPVAAEVGTDELRALALSQLGIAELWAGDLDRARRDLESARGAARAAGQDWRLVVCTAYLGGEAMLRGRYERAAVHCETADELARRRGWERMWPVGITATTLAGIAFQRDRVDEAERHHARAAERLQRSAERPLRACLAIQQAQICAARGRHEPALEALEEAREWLHGWPIMPALGGIVAALEATSTAALGDTRAAAQLLAQANGAGDTQEVAVALARLRLRDGDAEGARAAVAPYLDAPRTRLHAIRIETCVVAALACDALADHRAAAAALEQALGRAEAGGVRRPFLTEGALIAPLLRRQIRGGTSHRALAGELLSAAERPAATRAVAVLPDALSGREAAVLRFLPTMMSNQEIASELFVSVNTVKTHLKAIYRKLDVDGRRGAVRRARELSLLGPQ